MASRVGPRSVKDATRFTSTIPHATSKTASATPTSAATASPAARAAAKTASKSAAAGSRASRLPGETPEQRVQRLRQAHLAAQRAQVSTSDRLIDGSRRVLNVVHRWTVTGVVVFTVVAGIVSIYSVWDMVRYNRARRTEWLAAQRALEADTLATARLAYMQGKATPKQVIMVEDANARAEAEGVKLPPLLSPPERRTHFEESIQPKLGGGKSEGKGVFGAVAGLFGGSAKAAANETEAAAKDASASAAHGAENAVQAVEEKASAVWETELENQRRGGTLDQLGLDSASTSPTSSTKKGWRPW